MTGNGWPMYSSPEASPDKNETPLPERGDPSTRDMQGRFITGNIGGGRKPGSRNKLTDLVLCALAADFATHGVQALKSLREQDPGNYLRLVSSLVPRELVLEREKEPDFSDMTLEELEDLRREVRHNWSVQRMLRSQR